MALADAVSFFAASSGIGTFVFGSARPSFLTLAQAVTLGELVDGQLVSYLAQDATTNPQQREWGHGTFTAAGGGSIARTTVLGTVNAGIAGSGSPISFTTAPTVSLTTLKEDMLPVFRADPAGAAMSGFVWIYGGTNAGSSPNGSSWVGIYGGNTSGGGNTAGKVRIAGGNTGQLPPQAGFGFPTASITFNGRVQASPQQGGELGLYAGTGAGGYGAFAYLYGGSSLNAGGLGIFTGRGFGTTGSGGQIIFGTGRGSGTGNSGTLRIYTGPGGATGNAGNIQIYSGNGGGTSGNSGSIIMKLGTVVSGVKGNIIMTGLPTSSAGLPAGSVWNNGGVLNIV